MDLYKNWDNYAKQYNIDKWYTVIWKPKNIYFIAKFNSKW